MNFNKPMTNFEFMDILAGYKDFVGVFCRDELALRQPRKQEFGILNLDHSSNGGTHWVLWVLRNNLCWYFDGFGVDPCKEFLRYMKKYTIYYNTLEIQEHGKKYCGHLCLLALDFLSKGLSFQESEFKLYNIFNGIK